MKDIILESNTYIPEFQNGDFKVGDSDFQTEELLCILNKGNLLQFPRIGVGIKKYMESNANTAEISRAIRETFKQDNLNIETITYYKDGTININISKI